MDDKNFERTFFGSWKVTEKIGEGSFGTVYKLERNEYGVTYTAALKIITIPKSASEIKSLMSEGYDENSITEYFESFVTEFVNEIALMAKLKGNSNIVSYEDHAVIKKENELKWEILIRMEHLTPLLEYYQNNKVVRNDIIKLGIDICSALELCQKYDIVHRDIKPENIFVSANGDYKLGDFGIARTIEKTTGGLSKKGTYTYMAPEVYKGEEYGTNVDMYSLGIVLYRLLNDNKTPFLPNDKKVVGHHEREVALAKRMGGADLPKPVNATDRLAEIVLKACAYAPDMRYTSPTQMKADLEAVYYDKGDSSVIFSGKDRIEVEKSAFTSNQVRAAADIYSFNGEIQNEKTPSIYDNNVEFEKTHYMFAGIDEIKAKEEAERQRKAELEKKEAEEKARLRRIEEEKRKQEEAERLRKIEEEKQKKEEAESLRKIEEEKRKKEEAEKLRKIEEKKREKKRKEEEQLLSADENSDEDQSKKKIMIIIILIIILLSIIIAVAIPKKNSDEKTNAKTTDIIETTSDKETKKETTKPSTSKKPSTTKSSSKPGTTKPSAKPSTTKSTTKPATKPATTVTTQPPSTTAHTTQSTTRSTTQPPSTTAKTTHSTTRSTTQPPSTTAHTTQPTTHAPTTTQPTTQVQPSTGSPTPSTNAPSSANSWTENSGNVSSWTE